MQVWCTKAAAVLLVTSWVCLALAHLARCDDDQRSDETHNCGHSSRGLTTEEIEAFKTECKKIESSNNCADLEAEHECAICFRKLSEEQTISLT